MALSQPVPIGFCLRWVESYNANAASFDPNVEQLMDNFDSFLAYELAQRSDSSSMV